MIFSREVFDFLFVKIKTVSLLGLNNAPILMGYWTKGVLKWTQILIGIGIVPSGWRSSSRIRVKKKKKSLANFFFLRAMVLFYDSHGNFSENSESDEW